MCRIDQWSTTAVCATLLALSAIPAPAANFDVPGTNASLQDAIADAAISPDVDNVITISVSPVVTGATVVIGNEFGPGRQLVIRPAENLDRATIACNNSSVTIIHGASTKYVTLEDLDILRDAGNNAHIVVLDACLETLIQRCRIGSNFVNTAHSAYSNVIMFYPLEVTLKNNIIFAETPGTFEIAINVNMTDASNSVRLYNNDVSDYNVYGIRVSQGEEDGLVVLRNNVVINSEALFPEPTAYRTQVVVGPTVASSHNVAYASLANIQSGPGQDIAGTGASFLNFAVGDEAAAFVDVDWNMVFDANPDFYRLVNNGPLHDGANDYGMTVPDVFPDIEVIDDIEGDYRPGGAPLHTDRGADQIEPGTLSSVGPSGPTQIEVTSYPNPFNPTTTISYVVPNPGQVDIRVYDVDGGLVRILVNQHKQGGEHRVSWDGRDASGSLVASGVYFVRVESGGEVQTQKIALLK